MDRENAVAAALVIKHTLCLIVAPNASQIEERKEKKKTTRDSIFIGERILYHDDKLPNQKQSARNQNIFVLYLKEIKCAHMVLRAVPYGDPGTLYNSILRVNR